MSGSRKRRRFFRAAFLMLLVLYMQSALQATEGVFNQRAFWLGEGAFPELARFARWLAGDPCCPVPSWNPANGLFRFWTRSQRSLVNSARRQLISSWADRHHFGLADPLACTKGRKQSS